MNRTKLPIYSKNREKINWKVPSLFHYDEVVFLLFDYLKELGISPTIKSTYGSVKSTWGGGRPSGWETVRREDAEHIIYKHNDNGVSCCFTFSNFNIEESHLDDQVANLLLEIASEGSQKNYAIVSSDLLADYIKSRYPKIGLISSVLKPVYERPKNQDNPEYYNKLCEIYDYVTLRPEVCFDNSFLKKIKKKNKIEVIVNQPCIFNCPLTKLHYDFFAQVERGEKLRSEDFCNKEKQKISSIYKTTLFSNDDMDRILKLGFNNFKLAGRRYTKEMLIDIFAYYVFEPTGVYQELRKIIKTKTLN